MKKFIGEGASGKCYEISGGNVLKIFKVPYDISNLEKYKYFLRYKNDSILFPFEFKLSKLYIIGYVSKKAEGDKISECFFKYSLEKMSNDVIKLEKDLIKISNGKICISDVNTNGIFYNGNKFSIIDTDYFFISHLDKEDIFYTNIKKIKCLLFELLKEYLKKNNITLDDLILDEIRKYCIQDYEINQMLLNTKIILEKSFNKPIDKLEDIGGNNGYMYIRSYRDRKNKA